VNPRKLPFTKSDVVLLVDDHELVRYGMRLMVEALGCTVIEAGTGEESIDLAREQQVDLVFMDIDLPGIDGILASSRLLQFDKSLKVVILTGLQVGSVPKAVLQSGVHGYMTKSSAADEIEQAIAKVLQGEMYLSPSIADQLALTSFRNEEGEQSPFARLSKRELQVALLLMTGYRNGDAGETLYLSAKTVSTYKHRAFEKLKVTSTAELIKLAIHWGLIPP